MQSVSFSKNRFWQFLFILSVIGIILCWVATFRFGAGVAADSTKYLSVAESLLAGEGLRDHLDMPLLAWPPLYPILLAALSRLTGLDVFVVGWYFNVFLAGLNIFLSGIIFCRVFSEKPLYAYLGSLFVLLASSSLRMHATISSDPFYLTLTLGFLIAVDRYIKRHSYSAFLWMIVFSVLAPLQRYVGPAVCVTAVLVILIEKRKSIRVLLRDSILLGVASILPIAWWLLIHNIMTYGSLWGSTGDRTVDVLKNTELALTKMLHWFVPYLSFLMPILNRPLILLSVMALVIFLLNRKNKGSGRLWINLLAAPSAYPSLIYAVVYFAAVAVTIVTIVHRDLFSDRYYVMLLVPTVIFLFITFDTLIRPLLAASYTRFSYILILIFALWSVYPIYTISEYLANASTQGEPSGFNMYNNRTYRDMDLVGEMQRLREDQPAAIFYSNYVDAVWFYTGKPVALLPLANVSSPSEAYAGWPGDKPGYIVWFEPNEYKHYLSPEKIAEFASVQLVFEGEGGKLYYVQPR
ncbi:MAG TPA: hypothetical protein VFQ23_07735 [Anaerolineales bacterium]|nr:hypothetical protein [Anaerolineales bacterium]